MLGREGHEAGGYGIVISDSDTYSGRLKLLVPSSGPFFV